MSNLHTTDLIKAILFPGNIIRGNDLALDLTINGRLNSSNGGNIFVVFYTDVELETFYIYNIYDEIIQTKVRSEIFVLKIGSFRIHL